MQFAAQLLDHRPRVGTLAVELVDEGTARHVVALHLPVHGDRLRLHPRHAAEHENRAVQHAQRAFDLYREVHVARRVNDVDLVVTPRTMRGGRLDGDALFAFQRHGIHLGAHAILAPHLVNLVDAAREVKDAFSEGRLTRVDVCRDADVAEFLHRSRRR